MYLVFGGQFGQRLVTNQRLQRHFGFEFGGKVTSRSHDSIPFILELGST